MDVFPLSRLHLWQHSGVVVVKCREARLWMFSISAGLFPLQQLNNRTHGCRTAATFAKLSFLFKVPFLWEFSDIFQV